MKKLLSLALTLIMVVSCFTVGVSAIGIDYDKYKGFVYTEYDAKDGFVRITNYKGDEKEVTIPTEINGKKVETISRYGNIEVLHIPDGVEVLYIAKAKKLKTITVNKTNEKYAVKNNLLLNKTGTKLYGCPRGNTNPEIPETVTVIGVSAFYGGKFKKIKLPESVRRIGTYAFAYCENLTEIKLHRGLKRIETSAFENCKSLKSVRMPNSVKYAGVFAFKNCKNLESVKISKKMKGLSWNTFEGCSSLKTIKLLENIEVIGEGAFNYCDSLEKIYIYNPDCRLVYSKGYEFHSSIPKHSVIYGYKNSTAQKYAKKNGNKFVELK